MSNHFSSKQRTMGLRLDSRSLPHLRKQSHHAVPVGQPASPAEAPLPWLPDGAFRQTNFLEAADPRWEISRHVQCIPYRHLFRGACEVCRHGKQSSRRHRFSRMHGGWESKANHTKKQTIKTIEFCDEIHFFRRGRVGGLLKKKSACDAENKNDKIKKRRS